MRVGLVVLAFNRPDSLSATLSSVSSLVVPSNVVLEVIVSQDGPPDKRVTEVVQSFAESFHLHHLQSAENLGLRQHYFRCSDLVDEFDLLLTIEDDVVLSPFALVYLLPAVRTYGDSNELLQFSLYSPAHMEANSLPFLPLADDRGGFLLSVPAYWGQAWLPGHWSDFRSFMKRKPSLQIRDHDYLPDNAVRWPADTSWKRDFFLFLKMQRAYTWIPSYSLCSQSGVPGQHSSATKSHLRTPLLIGSSGDRVLPALSDLHRYDEYGEIEYLSLRRAAPQLPDLPVTVDLKSSKPLASVKTDYMLTTRSAGDTTATFGDALLPIEVNVVLGVPGSTISLARTSSVVDRPALSFVRSSLYSPSSYAAARLAAKVEHHENLNFSEYVWLKVVGKLQYFLRQIRLRRRSG